MKYTRTDKPVESLSARNKAILNLAREQGGVDEDAVAKTLGLRLQTARVEIKYLKKEGYLDELQV